MEVKRNESLRQVLERRTEQDDVALLVTLLQDTVTQLYWGEAGVGLVEAVAGELHSKPFRRPEFLSCAGA